MRVKNVTISSLKTEVAEWKAKFNSLDYQYKTVIDELRKQLKWWQHNNWKLTFLSLYNSIKSKIKRGGE